MQRRFVLFLLLTLFAVSLAGSAYAQSPDDVSLYEVTDVGVDITADSAAHARDQAIAQAQRAALEQLLGRFGAESTLATNATDDTIASLVQSFEVQNEHTSSVRYIGTFTVQFRPISTRDWLGRSGATFTEARSKSVIVLPIYLANGHPVLWEEHTKWWNAWESARNTGLVPILLPSGGLDDIAILSTEEAVNGDQTSIKGLIEKYQAGGAVIATLDGSLDTPGTPFKVQIQRYDADGNSASPISINLPPASDKASIDSALKQGVSQVRSVLEGNWRESVAKTTQTPALHLQVVVPIDTLDEWTRIKRKLSKVPTVERVNVVTLARGTTNIELEFRGAVEQLQDDLARQNLALTQDSINGSWILQSATSEAPL